MEDNYLDIIPDDIAYHIFVYINEYENLYY